MILADSECKLVIARVGAFYYPAKQLGAPADCLISAVCFCTGRFDLLGLATSLSRFGLTLKDCLIENPKITFERLLSMKRNLVIHLEARPRIRYQSDEILELEYMIKSIADEFSNLSSELMEVVEILRRRVKKQRHNS